jgi:hypothetical protein
MLKVPWISPRHSSKQVKDGTSTLDSLVEERGLATWERNWDTTIASSIIEGFDMAIAQLQQP